ncbi:MAG: glucose-1-phosphate thymidylyltransferase RfbA [Campylobacteraceae bacterium]|jgi:glucose-1-phosphate thymidylyltransferase|nr:glucose-1-phosphate thymidylyltransferase RfbA [Campylobacteraceae bacterium]
MKGIILAGGNGTRLYPITKGISKQLIPIYDKPMIYYPLSVLMLAGIREILIISDPENLQLYQKLLKDGIELGMRFEYKIQPSPNGIAEAFILGEEFIGDDDVCLILGDNLFFGHAFTDLLNEAVNSLHQDKKATIFGYYVNDPERYGVVEFNEKNEVISIEEKPKKPKSSYAVSGLYFYPNSVVNISKNITPSARKELEITDVNKIYLHQNLLNVKLMGRGYAWLDTGTHESLLQASHFIYTIEQRQGLKVACIEEIAYKMGFIDKEQLIKLAHTFLKNQYGTYLMSIANEN